MGSILGSLIEIYSNLRKKGLDQFDLIKEVNEFNKEIETLFLKFGSRHDIGLKRDTSFLKWRFKNSIEEKYKIVGLCSNSELVAVAVLKYALDSCSNNINNNKMMIRLNISDMVVGSLPAT